MPYQNNEKKVEQSAWNLSQSEVNSIASLRYNAQVNFLRGEIQKAFWYTAEIRELIHTDLKHEEDVILDKIEDNINDFHNASTLLSSLIHNYEDDYEDDDLEKMRILKNRLLKLNRTHVALVKNYRRKISEYLGKYGYLTTKKKDWEDNITF